jgi:hypothetical protein
LHDNGLVRGTFEQHVLPSAAEAKAQLSEMPSWA